MNKKGFTLIELLAVILILGIIALIAIPIVTNVIEDSKKEAAKDSVLSYIKAINDQNSLHKLQPNKYEKIESGNIEDLNINVKGEKPKSGSVTITNNKVTALNACIHGYNVIFENNKVTVGDSCNSSNGGSQESRDSFIAPTGNDTHKGIVYLNPKDLTVKCYEGNSQIGLDEPTESGCMKFYIFNDEGENYKMILDHDTSTKVAWYAKKNGVVSYPAQETLEVDTQGWEGNPRFITANEVAHLVGTDREDTLKWNSSKQYGKTNINTQVHLFNFDASGNTYSETNGWQQSLTNAENKSKYAWLFDYTRNCINYGCNNQNPNGGAGYWTADHVNYDEDNATWSVYSMAKLAAPPANYAAAGAVRPVIEISKSLFE